MPERVAIVGSREGASLADVSGFLADLWRKYPDTILVSGGAGGVDKHAEDYWLQLGGRVESLRPVKDGASWRIELWELGGPEPRVSVLINELSFDSFKSAAIYRDILIAERAARTVAFFRPGFSRGAGFTADVSEHTYGKPTYRYEATANAAP